MTRAGRSRKINIARKRGRIDWRAVADDPSLLTKWHRARDRISELGGDPRLASQYGKLHYLRQLTALEAEAAERWCLLLAENDRLILGMARTPSRGSLERFAKGGGTLPPPEEIKRFLTRFQAAQTAILVAGTKPLRALNRLCRDEASSSVLPEARQALAQLIAHFRLDSATGP